MDYLLKASGAVVILFLFYTIFLKNETFFKSIRGYFLVGLIVIIAIPLIEIPVYSETVSNLNMLDYEVILNGETSTTNAFNWIDFLTLLYIAGVAFFGIKFLMQLASLLLLLTKHSYYKKGTYYFVESSKEISPFSFFNIIFYNKKQFTPDELEQIINHEKAHALQWHSLDTILVHLVVIILWFNPFVWLYKKAVQQNLEFLADSYAIQLAKNQQLYQFTLLKTYGAHYCTQLANNFYNSLIKKRIIMIHKNKSSNKNQWKYVLLLPVFIVFITTFNTKIIAQEKTTVKQPIKVVGQLEKQPLILVNGKQISKEEMNKIDNNTIYSINVIKDNNSIQTYGEKGKNGVILITLKSPKDAPKTYIGHEIKPTDRKKANVANKNSTIEEPEIKIEQQKEEKVIVLNSGNTNKKPLYVLNGKEISNDVIERINTNSIKSMSVLKDENALEKYGEKGENGVIEVTTKKLYSVTIDVDESSKYLTKTASDSNPLIILNGKEISNDAMKKINTDNIKSVNVLKDKKATKKYGEKGKNGVIELFLKE